jgi:hypothetical protein
VLVSEWLFRAQKNLQLRLMPLGRSALPYSAILAVVADWQQGGGGSGSGCAAPAPAAATAAVASGVLPAPADDPWDSGLELLLANSTASANEPLGLPLHLTDAGLEALLAPFEDWACDPAAPAAAPPLLDLPHTASGAASQQGPCEGGQQRAQAGDGEGCMPTLAPSAPSAAPSPASSSGTGGRAPRRRGGRPRLHPASAPADAAAPPRPDPSSAGRAVEPYKKTGRGPKPKYVFSTREEAADARRERNRRAALESYYK